MIPKRVRPRVRARAFAPGHLTGLFVPRTDARDPRGRGSVGAGLVLERGVVADASYDPRASRRLVVRAEPGLPVPISRDVARRLYAGRTGALEVRLRHELPVGQGFGTSAAGALATGLAVARVLGVDRPRAVQVAHLADLFGGGGLGGVSALGGGGWERRVRPGVPPFGRAVHAPFRRPVWVALVDRPVRSPALLHDPTFLQRVADAGAGGLRRLDRTPSVTRFLDEAERFTDRLALGPPTVRRTIARLRAAGAWAAQAMFGGSVWAVARSAPARARLVAALDELGVPAVELDAARRGAGGLGSPRRRTKAF